MIDLSNLPFKPESLVYFAHEQGVKRGVVKSITCVYNKHAVVWLWQVEETLRGDKIMHEVQLNNLAISWEGMEDRLGLIYSFRQHMETEKKEGAEDGIF